ncbi:MAG: hypothetical protein GX241_04035 [Ruminococcaceae bacterium]|nr:hypothetical protein [Oscillospiraceae bacterium]
MNKTMIITDTCSDLPLELTDNYDIEIIATTFNIDDKFFSEGVDFSIENFYEILPAPKDKISNFYIPAAVYVDRYKKAFQSGFNNVLVIMAGNEQFPMHKAAKEAIDLFFKQYPEANIKIEAFYANNFSMASGFLVLEAAKLAAEKMDFEKLLETLHESASKMTLFVDAFHVPFSYKEAGMSWVELIKYKTDYHPFPALALRDGEAHELIIKKGDHSAFDQFYAYCIEALTRAEKPDYAIGYASREKEALAMALLLEQELGYPPMTMYKLGALSVFGASKAALAVAFKDVQ